MEVIEDESEAERRLMDVGSKVSFVTKRNGEYFKGTVYSVNPENGSFGIQDVSHSMEKWNYIKAEGLYQFFLKDVKDCEVLVPASKSSTITNTTTEDAQEIANLFASLPSDLQMEILSRGAIPIPKVPGKAVYSVPIPHPYTTTSSFSFFPLDMQMGELSRAAFIPTVQGELCSSTPVLDFDVTDDSRRVLLLVGFCASSNEKFWCSLRSKNRWILLDKVGFPSKPPIESETLRLFYAIMGRIVMICSGRDWCKLYLYDATCLTEESTVSLGILNLCCAGVLGNKLYVFGRSVSDVLMLKVFDLQTRIITETILSGYDFTYARSSQGIGQEIFFTRLQHVSIYHTVSRVVRSIKLPTPRAPRLWFDAATCAFHGVLLYHNYKKGLTWYDESVHDWKTVQGFNLAGLRDLTSLGLGISNNKLLVVWTGSTTRGVDQVFFCRLSLEKTQTGNFMGVLVQGPLFVGNIEEGYKVKICLSLSPTQDDDTGEASKNWQAVRALDRISSVTSMAPPVSGTSDRISSVTSMAPPVSGTSDRISSVTSMAPPVSGTSDRISSVTSMAPPVSGDSLQPRDVCVVGVARTPIGDFLGSLSSLTAPRLGSIAIEAALKRANVDPALVEEVFFGNVLTANLGQAPARQAALGAGIPYSVICTTVNKVCAAGMKAVMLAAQSIQLGLNDVVVAGGMESMSNVPKYLPDARRGSRLGHDTVVDGMMKDGLWDVYNDFGMGVCGEICADQYRISREEQDAYAIQSFERGIVAQNTRLFAWETVPVEVSTGRGRPSVVIDKDEGLGKFDAAKLKKLRPSFKEDGGSVTAGNASSISDGAAALVLVSGEKALELGLHVIAKIRGYADAAQAPELFTTTPALAIPKAIKRAGLEASQVDYYEINEAFSVVALANQKLLGLDPERLNAHGGAVSLGHPLGCSGARILVTLLGVLRAKKGKYGVASVCNGGGGASALVLEFISEKTIGYSAL